MNDIKLFENWFKSTKWFTGYNCTPKYITYRSMLQAWQASAQREGYKLVPLQPSSEAIVAIERKVENQLEASGINQDPFRLDGETIYEAMIGVVE